VVDGPWRVVCENFVSKEGSKEFFGVMTMTLWHV